MKIRFLQMALFITMVILITSASAQIPNSGFESWTNGNPDGWVTDNILGLGTPVTQSSDAHSGSSSAKLSVISVAGQPFPAWMYTIEGVPINYRAGSLTGYYKFSPAAGSELFYVSILLAKNGSYIGSGEVSISSAQSSYTQLVVPISYATNDVPDSAYIYVAVGDSSSGPTIGSVAYLDDLSFGNATGVQDKTNKPLTFKMDQNYPNPFNPSTKIQYTIPEASVVTLKVYNILGSQVKELLNEKQSAGTHLATFNATDLPSGIYIAKLTAGTYTKTIKMTLLK